jgi:hypothetical protein
MQMPDRETTYEHRIKTQRIPQMPLNRFSKGSRLCSHLHQSFTILSIPA